MEDQEKNLQTNDEKQVLRIYHSEQFKYINKNSSNVETVIINNIEKQIKPIEISNQRFSKIKYLVLNINKMESQGNSLINSIQQIAQLFSMFQIRYLEINQDGCFISKSLLTVICKEISNIQSLEIIIWNMQCPLNNIRQKGQYFTSDLMGYNDMEYIRRQQYDLSDEFISIISNTLDLSKMKNLHTFHLDLKRWGMETFQITGKAFNILGNQFLKNILPKSLKSLKINQQSWNRQKSGNSLDSYTDSNLCVLTENFKSLQSLEKLQVQWAGIGKSSTKITGKPIDILMRSISKLKLRELILDFYCFAENNETIGDDTLVWIGEGIYKLKNTLEKLNIDLTCWGRVNIKQPKEKKPNFEQKQTHQNMVIGNSLKFSNYGLQRLFAGLQQCYELQDLNLNLEQMAFLNRQINEDSLVFLSESLLELRKKNKLKNLNLNLRSWGNSIKNFTDYSFYELFKSIGQIKSLNKLTLNLEKCAIKNEISDTFVEKLLKEIQNIDALQYLDLNLAVLQNNDNCYSQSSLKGIGEFLQNKNTLRYLSLEFQFQDKENFWNSIEYNAEFDQLFKKFVFNLGKQKQISTLILNFDVWSLTDEQNISLYEQIQKLNKLKKLKVVCPQRSMSIDLKNVIFKTFLNLKNLQILHLDLLHSYSKECKYLIQLCLEICNHLLDSNTPNNWKTIQEINILSIEQVDLQYLKINSLYVNPCNIVSNKKQACAQLEKIQAQYHKVFRKDVIWDTIYYCFH